MNSVRSLSLLSSSVASSITICHFGTSPTSLSSAPLPKIIRPTSEPIQNLCSKILSLPSISKKQTALIFDSETENNIDFLREKVKGNAPIGKLEPYIRALGSLLFQNHPNHPNHPNHSNHPDYSDKTEIKNWLRLHKAQLRKPNSFLDSLTQEQKEALCNPSKPITAIAGPLHELGGGARGVVYRAQVGGRTLALKVGEVKDDYWRGEGLVHQRIVEVLTMVEKEKNDFLFMEYVHGETFGEILEHIEPREMLRYAAQAAGVFSDLQGMGLYYSEFHDNNVMRCNGSLKLIDAGSLVRVVENSKIVDVAADIRALLFRYLDRRSHPLKSDTEKQLESFRKRLVWKGDDEEIRKAVEELAHLEGC